MKEERDRSVDPPADRHRPERDVDIDAASESIESDDDIEPPGKDGNDGEDYGGESEGEEESEGERYSWLQFTPSEQPLLGYMVSSFVFFLSAVGRKAPSFNLRRLDETMGSNIFNNIANEVMEDIDWETGEFTGDETGMSYLDNIYGDGNYEDDYGFGLSNLGCGASFLGIAGMLPTGYYVYALLLGLIGTLSAGGILGYLKFNGSKADKPQGDRPLAGETEGGKDEVVEVSEGDPETKNNVQAENFLTLHGFMIHVFLFLWAFIGFIVFMFVGQAFRYTGNGFFALWAMILFAAGGMGLNFNRIKQEVENADSCLLFQGLVSIVTIIELTTQAFGLRGLNSGIIAYVLSVAVIGLVFALTVVGLSKLKGIKLPPKIMLCSISFLLLLWIVAACLATFVGPFTMTGNGYFSVWGSVILTGLVFVHTQKEL